MESKREYTSEEIAKIAPHYRGKAKNFDPAKVGKGRAKPNVAPQKEQKAAKPPIMTMPKPTLTEANSEPTKQKNSSLLAESIFGQEVTVVPIAPEERFQASYSAVPTIASEVYREYAKDVQMIDRLMIKEEMCYYFTALFWLRMLDLKSKYGLQALTAQEKTILKDTKDDKFNIPQPFYAYLASIGSVTDKMGKKTYHQVPSLPVTVVNGFGGYHANAVDENSHVLFEEIPSLGVAGDVLMACATAEEEPVPDFHVAFPRNGAASDNFLGKPRVIGARRQEIRQTLAGYGITPTAFEEYCEGTRFHRQYVRALSDRIGKWETFRLESTNFQSMTSEGGTVQIVQTRPTDIPAAATLWTSRDAQNTSPEEETTAVMGAGFMFRFQLYKSSANIGETRLERNRNWCCVRTSPDAPPGQLFDLPQTWIANMNVRRHLPDVLGIARFRAITMNCGVVTENIVRHMVKTRR